MNALAYRYCGELLRESSWVLFICPVQSNICKYSCMTLCADDIQLYMCV